MEKSTLYYPNQILSEMKEAIRLAEEKTGLSNKSMYIDENNGALNGFTLIIKPTEEAFLASVFTHFGVLCERNGKAF